MVNTQLLLVDGAILCGVIGAIVTWSFFWKPRIWLHDLPEDIRALVPPPTPAEKRWLMVLGLPVTGGILAGCILSVSRFGFEAGFFPAVLHAYLPFQIFNLFDLVMIDWGTLLVINPAKPPIPGTENAAGWRNYGFFARGFFKGIVIGAIFAPIAAGIAWLIGMVGG